MDRIEAAAEAVRVMNGADERPAERTRRILRQRASQLARPIEEPRPATEVELVAFSIGPARYGIELASVREVLPLPTLVPVPHTPAWVAGVMGYRGRVLAVVDLGQFLASPGGPQGPEEVTGRHLLVLELPEMLVGMLVDSLHGIVSPETALLPSPAGTEAEGRASFIRGIAPGGIAVLDVNALAQHPRFQVNG